MIEPRQPQTEVWLFDDSAVTIVHCAMRLRQELELRLAGIAVALTLLDENAQLTWRKTGCCEKQQLARFLAAQLSLVAQQALLPSRLRGRSRSIQDATFFDDIEPLSAGKALAAARLKCSTPPHTEPTNDAATW